MGNSCQSTRRKRNLTPDSRHRTYKKNKSNKNKRNYDEEDLELKSSDDIKFRERENKNKIDLYEKSKVKELKIKKKEIKVILRGFTNIRATCYMNATLQCLKKMITKKYQMNIIYY